MTLIELLVVLIIIGVLGAVTLRAMDATRERANYEKTFKTLERLSQAIAGNPSLVAEGRRTDFGFVGDVGRLPTSLDELRSNLNSNPSWNGPYVRLPFVADENSFKTDAWGQELQYLPEQATLISLANGRSPITYKVVNDTGDLTHNPIRGSVTDRFGNVPAAEAASLRIRLWLPDPITGQISHRDVTPGDDGRYVFDASSYAIPVGSHQLTAVRSSAVTESIIKWVTVTPRVGAIVDFRLSTPFVGKLQLIGHSFDAYPPPTYNNISFDVFNSGPDMITLTSLWSLGSVASETAYCESLKIRFADRWNWNAGGKRSGPLDNPSSDTMRFSDSLASSDRMRIDLKGYKKEPTASPGTPSNLRGKTMRFRFSDGSIISVPINP